MLGTILLVIVILFLVGGLRDWGPGPFYGAGPVWGGGGLGLVLMILLILVLLGHL